MTVPSNLIPVRVLRLPEAPVASPDFQLVGSLNGTTYRVRAGDLLNVNGVPTTRNVFAGTGMTGGGQLSSDITLSIAVGGVDSTLMSLTGVAAGTYGSSAQVPLITVDAAGRIESITLVGIAGTAGGTVTNVALSLSDGIAGSVTDPTFMATINLSLTDITPDSVTTGAISGTNITASSTVSGVTGSFSGTLTTDIATITTSATVAGSPVITQSTGDTRYVNVTGDTMTGVLNMVNNSRVGDGTTGANLILDGAAALNRVVQSRSNDVLRWYFGGGNAAESGSDAGTPFEIAAYTDSGIAIDKPISILRAAGGAITTTRVALGPAGSAAAPTWSFSGDPNTGIYNYAADGVGVSTGGVLKARFGSTGTVFGDGTALHQVFCDSAAGTVGDYAWRSGGSLRWLIRKNGTAESGSDAGGNLEIAAFTDAGAVIDSPLTIIRAAGGPITFNRVARGTAGSAAAPTWSFSGDPDTGVYFPAGDELAFTTGGTFDAKFDAGGRFLIGGAATDGNQTSDIIQFNSTGSANFGIGLSHWNASNGSKRLAFSRSRGATVGAHTAVQSGDQLGTINAFGSDGSAFVSAASIQFYADNTFAAGAGDGRILFAVHSGGSSTQPLNLYANQARFATGTAALPSIAFAGDNDTGLYSAVANNLAFAAAGLQAMNLTSTAVSLFDGAGTGRFYVVNSATGVLTAQVGNVAGSNRLDLDVMSPDGLGDATIRVFRNTNTTGSRNISLMRGDNTAVADHIFSSGSSGLLIDLCRNGGQVGTNAGTAAAPSYARRDDLNTGMYFPAADNLAFSTGGTAFLAANGNSITTGNLGDSSHATINSTLPYLQVNQSATGFCASYRLIASNAAPPTMVFLKARGSLGAETAVASGDFLGHIWFQGYDGTDYDQTQEGAAILVQATAAYTADSRPARMIFRTNDGTASTDSVARLTIEPDGRIHGANLHNNSGSLTGTTNQYIASGTYTPTLTNVANLDASTAYVSQWMRVGNVVTVSMKFDADPTTANVLCQLGVTLPIASAFTNARDCAGGGAYAGNSRTPVAVLADLTNDRAEVRFYPDYTANGGHHITFTYLVL